MPKYFDIHAHMNFVAFPDRDEVIKKTLENEVWMMNVGTQKDTSLAAITLAEKYEAGVYASVALHPVHTSKSYHDESELGEGGKEFTSRGEIFDYELYKQLAMNPKVRAIGECGLDYFRTEPESKEKQKKVFIDHIRLANEVGKPLMLHIREAYADAYEILKSESKSAANLHFFAGNLKEAKKFLDLGCTLSFTGVITFARNYDDVIRYLPLDHMMSETDCPYVSPAPFRGKRNEPQNVREVVKKIAEIRGENFESVRNQLVLNAERFLNISA